MKRTRLARLERYARERPCPGCGRTAQPVAAGGDEADFGRLTADERRELALLVGAMATPPCPRCGRAGHDLTRMTDGQLDRALHLLRRLYDRAELECLGAPDEP